MKDDGNGDCMPQYLRRRDAETFFNMAVEESSIYPWQYNMHMNRFHFLVDCCAVSGIPMIRTCWHVMRWTPLYIRRLVHTRRNFDAILLGNEINSRMSFRLKSADGSYEWWEFRSTAYDGLTVDTPYMVLGVCQSIQRYKDTEEALIAARPCLCRPTSSNLRFLPI